MNKTVNPNVELFRRTAPTSKVELVNNMSDADILKLSASSVLRMVKETGNSYPRLHSRLLHINSDRQAGNEWNSWVEGLGIYKGKLLVHVYVQYSNTDTTDIVEYDDFFRGASYRGTIKHTDRYGNTQHSYYNYDAADRAKVLRSICLEYLYRKYADKLTA